LNTSSSWSGGLSSNSTWSATIDTITNLVPSALTVSTVTVYATSIATTSRLNQPTVVAGARVSGFSRPCSGPASHAGNDCSLRGTSGVGPEAATRTTVAVAASSPSTASTPAACRRSIRGRLRLSPAARGRSRGRDSAASLAGESRITVRLNARA
jgi:hypothetical protein